MSTKHWLLIALAVVAGAAVVYIFGDKVLGKIKDRVGV
jgi:hypothetical protein